MCVATPGISLLLTCHDGDVRGGVGRCSRSRVGRYRCCHLPCTPRVPLPGPTVNRRAERYVPSAYPTTAHDTRVIAAAWLRVIGGDPAFQGDPGLLLEITRDYAHVCPSISPRRRPLRAPCCANPSRDRRPAASCPLPAPQTFSPPTSHGPTSPPGRDCVLPLLNLRVRGKPNTNCRPPRRCDRTTPHPHCTACAQCPVSQKSGSNAISP